MNSPRLEAFESALNRLQEALSVPPTDIVRDACIQRFEFCFELAWKTVQEAVRVQGGDCVSPRSCLRQAFKMGWLENEELWITMLAERNLTSHTYDESLAKAVYGRLPQYLPLFAALQQRLSKL